MKIVVITVFVVALLALVGLIVQSLWNALVPDIFSGMHSITYWQAVGLMLLSSFLLRSWQPKH
jgi:hypothetical protein